MIHIVFFVLGSVCVFAQGESRFKGKCPLFSKPAKRSKALCRADKKLKIIKITKETKGYLFVKTPRCEGFAPKSCIVSTAPKEAATNRPTPRKIKRTPAGKRFRNFSFLVTTGGNFGLLWSKTPYTAAESSGSGFGGSLSAGIRMIERLEITLGYVIQRLKSSVTVEQSTILDEDFPESFTHKIVYMGPIFRVRGYIINPKRRFPFSLGVESGLEYLFPTSAKQDDSIFGERDFDFTDKAFLLSLGTLAAYDVGESVAIVARLDFYLNLGGSGGSGFSGVRIGAGLHFIL